MTQKPPFHIRESPYDRIPYRPGFRSRGGEAARPRLRVAVVTGANGFLGAHLVRALLARGVEVRAVVRPTSDVRVLAGLDIDLRRGALDDAAFMREVLRGADALFHLAALYSQRPEDIGLMYRVNVGIVRALMKLAWDVGVPRIVHTSTIGTIGRRKDGLPPDESVPFNLWDRASHYVRSKHLGELAALTWAGMGAPIVVVNPTAPVGAYDWRPTATGRRILAVLEGRVPSYPPGGINFVPARDVAEGMILAALKGVPGERYILGHSEGNLDLDTFLRLVGECAGLEPLKRERGGSAWRRLLTWGRRVIRRRRAISGHAPDALTANPRKAIDELDMPQSDLRTAFEEAVRWFHRAGLAPPLSPSTREQEDLRARGHV